MTVELSFVGDIVEVHRTREALAASRGTAWIEQETALFFETRFVINGVEVFGLETRSVRTFLVGSDGTPAGVDYHPVSGSLRIPLLNVMASGRRAFGMALATGRGTWSVAGGGTLTFVLLNGQSVKISGTSGTKNIEEVATVGELRAAFDEFRKAASEYVATHLPELLDHPGWASAVQAYE